MAPTFTPDRQTFRALVADVAARAKARLPESVNGRIESAVKLVLQGDVLFCDDGTIEVGSSDPTRSYKLVGTACTCTDFTSGKAPDGWCKHRTAAGIAKRVGEVLAAQAPQEGTVAPQATVDTSGQATAPQGLGEAPASANVRVQMCGREVQLTLRDTDETRLLERLTAVLAQFPVEPKPQPQAPEPLSHQQHHALAQGQKVTGVCPVHSVQMQLNDKNGRQWYSHRTADGQWCKGR
jgi:hypothetical protein